MQWPRLRFSYRMNAPHTGPSSQLLFEIDRRRPSVVHQPVLALISFHEEMTRIL